MLSAHKRRSHLTPSFPKIAACNQNKKGLKSTMPIKFFSLPVLAFVLFLVNYVFPLAAFPQNSQTQSDQAALDARKIGLAQRYFNARPDLMALLSVNRTPDTLDDAGIDKLVRESLQSLSSLKNWNPSNQNWPKAQQILNDAVKDYVAQVRAEKKQMPDMIQVQATVNKTFSSQLSFTDLTNIVEFYESPAGVEFVSAHTKMFNDFAQGMLVAQQMAATGQHIATGNEPDMQQFQTLLSLYSEFLVYQMAVLDSGAGGDRTGLQALRIVTPMIVRIQFDTLNGIWNGLSLATRQQVLFYRSSPIWTNERNALTMSWVKTEQLTHLVAMSIKFATEMSIAINKIKPLLPTK